MKILGLVYVCIVLSTLQVVLGHDNDVQEVEDDNQDEVVVRDLATRREQRHHRQIKKAGGGGGKNKSAKKNPCSNVNTFIAAYQSISDQCAGTDAAITTGFTALETQVFIYCDLLALTETTFPQGTYGVNMGQLVSDYCSPLISEAAQADYAYSGILSRENSIDSLYYQMSSLYNQAVSLISQCVPTGIVPADMTTPPISCYDEAPPTEYYTSC